MAIFDYLKKGLAKTREGFIEKIEQLITGYKKLDDDFYEELEQILIEADLGAQFSMELVEKLEKKAREEKVEEPKEAINFLKEEIVNILGTEEQVLKMNDDLTIILAVGVNGVGKTTTIGKLAHKFRDEGKKVILAAGDTFRAAAIEQLEVWANRTGAELIKQKEGSDPASIAYDAINAALARKADVLIIDTAGRLHTKTNLMEEIKKVKRIIEREYPGAPHEVLLVIDACTGQNALEQARLFNEATGVSGIVLTKLDGTAKGGIVISISHKLDIPVKFIGVGEGIDDLKVFNPKDFTDTLFDRGE